MTGTGQLQATIPVEELACEVLPFHIYDMTWEQFIVSNQCLTVRQYDIKEQKYRPAQAYVTMDYLAAYKAISKDCHMSKMNTLSNGLKLGLSIWQHEHQEVYKKTVDARQKLYYNNYAGYLEIFGRKRKIWENQEGTRTKINVYGDVTEILPAVSEYADYLNISESEFCAVLLGIAFLRWDKLPALARTRIDDDVRRCIEQQTSIAKACGLA